MVVKAFTGGWEQSSTVSVQCLVTPADSVLNDTTGDFMVRDSILDMFVRANADSAFDAGFNITHPGWNGGWVHETGMTVWRLPNGGGIEVDTLVSTYSDACTLGGDGTPPVPGAVLLGDFHGHPSPPGYPQYCKRKIQRRPGGPITEGARSPAEAAQGRPFLNAVPDTTSADRADRSYANRLGKPEYVLKHNGRLLKIAPVANDSLPNPQTWYRISGGTATQQKCAWPPPKR
jgi:hypothetical protein